MSKKSNVGKIAGTEANRWKKKKKHNHTHNYPKTVDVTDPYDSKKKKKKRNPFITSYQVKNTIQEEWVSPHKSTRERTLHKTKNEGSSQGTNHQKPQEQKGQDKP